MIIVKSMFYVMLFSVAGVKNIHAMEQQEQVGDVAVQAQNSQVSVDVPDQDVTSHHEDAIEIDDERGMSTVGLEDTQGNWFFKKVWRDRAQDLYEKIRERSVSIWESRATFFSQRNDLDRSVLDPFYVAIGMGQGEFQAILNELEGFFLKERELEGDLSPSERSLYQALEEEQEAFKQLKLDVESIAKLDHALDDALGILMDQINTARQLEKQAWDSFKEISHILNDMKARELYYSMDGAWRNIKNISLYLERDFANHFTQLVAQAKKYVTRVQSQMNALKEKGVDFKRQVDRLAQQQKEEEEQEKIKAEQEQEELQVKPKQTKKGWMEYMSQAVISLVKWPYELIAGTKK